MTTADLNVDNKTVYRIDAVVVSREGGSRQRSVWGGAESVKEPMHLGMGCWGFRRVKKGEGGGIMV